MRGLLISDIHANPWALQAVAADAGSVDFVLCAGDWVNYGPEPNWALAWALDNRALTVLGNHDYAVTTGADPRATAAKQPLALSMIDWTRSNLCSPQSEFLIRQPKMRTARFGGATFQIVHGTPLDPLYDYRLAPDLSETDFGELLESVKVNVLVVGHTHLPFVRRHNALCVVNPGSVGQPLDGDPRASYAIWEDGAVQLRRVEYDQRPVLNAIENLPCLTDEQRRKLQKTLLTGQTY